MQIETERLILRPFQPEDGEGLYEYLSDAEVVRYEPYTPMSPEEAREEAGRRAKNNDFWAVCKKDGQLIGNLYFSKGDFNTWELGYVFNRKYWGKGYASESVQALLDVAFREWDVRRVVAMCDPKNTASWRLMERLGMRREGELKQNVYFFCNEEGDPIWKDTYEYGLLREEWI